MKDKGTIVIVCLAIVLLGAAGYRCLQILPYPIGTGDEATSPDGAFVASVTQYHDETFWGSSRDWVEFEIRRKGSTTPIRTFVSQPIPGAVFGSRTDTKVVYWSQDSQSVDFVFPGTTVTLQVTKKNGR